MSDTWRAYSLCGSPDWPTPPLELHAGALTAQYENGSLRYLKLGGLEILRRIFPALRDHNWATIVPTIRDEKIQHDANSFQISYSAEYRCADIHFTAQYSMIGTPGAIRFNMIGHAHTPFLKNRIGFCVLHPIQECAGKPCVVFHPDGTSSRGVFPFQVCPDQPFRNIRAMQWQPGVDVEAEIDFTGDVFEMEDQRNWVDASYKTYCTPLALPFPVRMRIGQTLEQSVDLRIRGKGHVPANRDLTFTFSSEKMRMPRLGLAASYLRQKLSDQSLTWLKKLGLNHYRFDVRLAAADWSAEADRELANTVALQTTAEVALHIEEFDEISFRACVEQLKIHAALIRQVIVFNAAKKTTDGELLRRTVPHILSALPEVKIGAGTDCFFAELNRERTPTELVDFLTFSVNPQVHASDQLSLVETMQAHGYVGQSAQLFGNGKAIHISPVTLKMRFNPNATGPEPQLAADQLPATVDARQQSLFGAGWTLGCLKYLAESGVASITCFETVGWRGVLLGEKDSPLPDKFPAQKGDVFPIWQVFKWLLEQPNGFIVPLTSSQPLLVDGMLLEVNGLHRLIVANYTPTTQFLALPEPCTAITVIDETNLAGFKQNPDQLLPIKHRTSKVELRPFALACVDLAFSPTLAENKNMI